jgi:hypothetical protein
MDLDISNVITVSVANAPAGLVPYNTSNLAIFTRDAAGGGFGALGYKAYRRASDVLTDFGSGSATYAMALKVFGQQPNILTGGGQLIVIPFIGAELIDVAIVRAAAIVQFFGILVAEISTQAHMLSAAAVVQTMNKIAFWPSRTAADVAPGGMLDLLRSNSYDQSRGLFYEGAADQDALNFAASYAGRGLSVDFSGSNTTLTMNLKTLVGMVADPAITQTVQNQCSVAGVDTYVSIEGVAKVLSQGTNNFFDRVYNRQSFVGAIQVRAFNYLAQTSTKIPQTEDAMTGFKGALRSVCDQYVFNQYLAPGVWTNPDTFGVPADLIANVAQRGYYVYSQPISQQDPAARALRQAPLAKMGIKEAGAIHSASILIEINA